MLSSAPTCAPQLMSPVLHIDVDTFFCQVSEPICMRAARTFRLAFNGTVIASPLQVEQNRHPSLKGRAFAIQQHQDIIAV